MRLRIDGESPLRCASGRAVPQSAEGNSALNAYGWLR
jgi:hypothetical protein